MSNFMSVSLGAIRARGAISSADVLSLRQEIYGGAGEISKEQAEEIMELDRVSTVQDSDWADFFIEVITDYIVEQSEPRGYITVENAQWLITQVEPAGRVQTTRGIELLANVLDKSRWSPTVLVQFALNQVKLAFLEGEGQTGDGGALEPGVIGEADVELIRRILLAFGGDGNIAITRAEAEILFDLNEMTSQADNHPCWTDLFTKSIANYVMAASDYHVPSRGEVLRRENWLNERDGVQGYVSKMVTGGLKGVWDAYHQQSGEELELARLERQKIQIITAEVMKDDEAGWLAARILRDGELCENEKALLEFLRDAAPDVHPSLRPLLAEAA